MGYFSAVIRSFSDKDTEKVWREVRARRWPKNLRRAALRKLILLHTAERLEDLLFPPGNYLEKLRDDREGQHSLWINSQWPICFRWTGNDAEDVEIVDYH